MTTNAYIFMWDVFGIESIVPITDFENWDRDNTMRILQDKPPIRNPLNSIIQQLMLRARFNGQRSYEIYAIDCADVHMTEQWWRIQWETNPQNCADVIRQMGHKIYSDYEPGKLEQVVR
jgi:hypothetical protein